MRNINYVVFTCLFFSCLACELSKDRNRASIDIKDTASDRKDTASLLDIERERDQNLLIFSELDSLEFLIEERIELGSTRSYLLQMIGKTKHNQELQKRIIFLLGNCLLQMNDPLSASLVFGDLCKVDSANTQAFFLAGYTNLLIRDTNIACNYFIYASDLGDSASGKFVRNHCSNRAMSRM